MKCNFVIGKFNVFKIAKELLMSRNLKSIWVMEYYMKLDFEKFF
jgi:hypothetical protein